MNINKIDDLVNKLWDELKDFDDEDNNLEFLKRDIESYLKGY